MEPKTNAGKILHNRYIKGDPEREHSIEVERLKAEIEQLRHDLKSAAVSFDAIAKDAGVAGTSLETMRQVREYASLCAHLIEAGDTQSRGES